MVIGSYSYHTAKKALLNRTFDQLISLRLEKKNQIEQFFHDRDRELNLLAKSSEIKQLTNLFCSNIKTDNINSNLSSYISSFGYSQRLYIADNNGRIIDIDSIQSRQQNNIVSLDNYHSVKKAVVEPIDELIKPFDISNDKLYF